MTAQPQYYQQQGYPQQPQQYAPQFPVAPQQPQYAPPPQYQQAPPQYGQPVQPVQPPQNVSMDDFFNAPSAGGGKPISWKGKPDGYWVMGTVSRPLTAGDFRQSVSPQGVPQVFRDGRPKPEMIVPFEKVASADPQDEWPDGIARWFVRGQARDELVRAMTEAGVPQDLILKGPEAGAVIAVLLSGRRPSGPGMNPANVVTVQYQRPANAPIAPPESQLTQPAPQAPPAQPDQIAGQQSIPVPPQVPQAQVTYTPQPPAPQPQAPAQPAPQPPAGLNPEQQEILNKLTS